MTETLDTRHVLMCQWCGHAFTAKRLSAKTCSDKCRKRLSRWRHFLTRDYADALKCVDGIASYLKYADFCPIASKGLLQLKAHIDRVLYDAKVKVVR